MQKLRKKIESAAKWIKNPAAFLVLALFFGLFFSLQIYTTEAADLISATLKANDTPGTITIDPGASFQLSWKAEASTPADDVRIVCQITEARTGLNLKDQKNTGSYTVPGNQAPQKGQGYIYNLSCTIDSSTKGSEVFVETKEFQDAEKNGPAIAETGACDGVLDSINPVCLAFGLSYAISYILGAIAGVIVMLETWALQIIIGISSGIAGSAVVTAGFGPALSIANLGFVIAIIVIAISTILRNQSYGIKQIFWKLIIAAILVNFSLTIAGEILNFGDNFGNYFLNQIGGNVDGGFAAKITTAFQPQQAIQNNNVAPDEHAIAALAGKTIGGILSAIASLAASLFALLIIIITLGALIVMLVIRYVYLGFLLVLMPLAWLAWIFPGLSSWWSKWWSNFFRWVFFYPLVLFFLNLMITVATTTRSLVGNFKVPTGPYGALTTFLGNTLAEPLTVIMQAVILAGLGIGGLIAANSLSITGAKGGMEALQGAGKWIASGTGKLAGRAAMRPLRGEGGRNLANRLQSIGAGSGRIGRALGSPLRGIGRLAEKATVSTGEKDIETKKKELSGLTKNERFNKAISATMMRDRIAVMSTFTPQEHAEFNEELKKRKLDSNKFYGHETKAAFEQLGQGKLYKDGRQASGKEFEDILNDNNKKQQSALGIEKLKERQKTLQNSKNSGAIMTDKEIKELDDVNGKVSQIQKDYPDDLSRYLQKVPGAGEHAANYFKDTDNEEHKTEIAGAVANSSPSNLLAFAKQIENSGKLDDFAKTFTKNNIKFNKENEKLIKKGGAGLEAVGFSTGRFNLPSEEEEREEKETTEKKTKTEKEEKEKQERATSRTQEVETSLKDTEEALRKAQENFENLTKTINNLANEVPRAEEAVQKAEESLRTAEAKLNTPQIIVEGRSGEEIRAEREKERATAQTQRQIALDTLNKTKASHETAKIQQQEAVRTVEALKTKRDQTQREAERAQQKTAPPPPPPGAGRETEGTAPSGEAEEKAQPKL